MPDDNQTQITLRDSIEQAIDTHEPELQQQEPIYEKPRDEKGKFTSKQETNDAVENTEQPIEQPQVKARPSSWKKDYEEHWTKLDPTLQDYINQREADYAKGVSTYKQNWDNAAPIYEAMQPFLPLLQENNIQPNQWISNLGNAHKTLALGSPEEKLQMFARLANDYGVNLGALTGQQQYDPQFSMITQELSQVKNQLNDFKTQREQQETQAIESIVTDFGEKNPNLELVFDEVMGLLQSGLIKGATPLERLQTAYDKAIRLNDDIWQKQQAEVQQTQAQNSAKLNQQKVAEAKAKAVSTKSSSPTGLMNSGNGKKDLRSTLEEQVNAAFEGRV